MDIDLAVDERGGLHLRSGEQRFYERSVAFRFPMFLSGVADVHEWYDDATNQFRVDVRVSNRRWGPLFGYRGHFQVEWRAVGVAELPADVAPRRIESRE